MSIRLALRFDEAPITAKLSIRESPILLVIGSAQSPPMNNNDDIPTTDSTEIKLKPAQPLA
jgi:hypothetical protein